jgi:hypothetical protein
MFRRSFSLLGLLVCNVAGAQSPGPLGERLAARIAQAPATGVGLYYRSLTHPDSLLLDANVRFHAASTMKLPVLIQVFRDADAGLLRLDDSLTVHVVFPSLVDGSPFDVDKADDSDSTLYGRVGRPASIRDLLELMITRSSNLATNILIERVGAGRAQASARALGAWSIQVLRGVEDGKAYRAGSTTRLPPATWACCSPRSPRTAQRARRRVIRCSPLCRGRSSMKGFPPASRPGRVWRTRPAGSARWCITTPRSCIHRTAGATCWWC